MTRVYDVMSKVLVSCRESANLHQVAQAMWENDCGLVAILNEDAALVGVITDRDVCVAGRHSGGPLALIPVTSAMTRELFVCHPDDAVDVPVRIMQRAQVHRIPVVDESRRLLGIVGLYELAAAAQNRLSSIRPQDVVDALAVLGPPRRGLRRPQGGRVGLNFNAPA